MIQALFSLFEVDRLIAFMVGLATYWIASKILDRVRDRRDPAGRPHHTRYNPVITFGGIAIVIVGVIGSGTYENWECNRQFGDSLRANRALSLENDRLSREQRSELARGNNALGQWVHALIAPPPDIAKLDINDPARYQYGVAVTREYFGTVADVNAVIAASQKQELANDEERAAHPLPEPTCGR